MQLSEPAFFVHTSIANAPVGALGPNVAPMVSPAPSTTGVAPPMMSSTSGSTSQNWMVVFAHLVRSGSLSLIHSSPHAFFCLYSSPASFSSAIVTVMNPFVTMVEHSPNTGAPHESRRVMRATRPLMERSFLVATRSSWDQAAAGGVTVTSTRGESQPMT